MAKPGSSWGSTLRVVLVNLGLIGALLLVNYVFALRPTMIFRLILVGVLVQFQIYLRSRLVAPLIHDEHASEGKQEPSQKPARTWSRAIQAIHVAFALLSTLTPAFMMTTRGPLVSFGLICYFSNIWIFFLLLAFSLIRFVLRRLSSARPPWSRRAESLFVIAAVLVLALLAYREASLEFEVNHVSVEFEGLVGQQRLTVTHLSDLHLGPVLGVEFCQRVLAATQDLDSDLIVITGDLFDIRYVEMAEAVPECVAKMRARHGVFFITGNHDHYTDSVHLYMDDLRRYGVHVLENSCHRVHIDAHRSFILDIVGVNDLHAARMNPDDQPRVSEAIASCAGPLENGHPVPRLFLAHQPNHIDEIDAHSKGVPTLMLSGHTHAGQVFPITWIVHLANRYTQGLSRHSKDLLIFVSRGTGQWGPPLRLGARAEIVQLHLRPNSE